MPVLGGRSGAVPVLGGRYRYRDLPDDTIGSAAHQQLSLETAEQSIVLLRNDLSAAGLARLPLKPGRKLAVSRAEPPMTHPTHQPWANAATAPTTRPCTTL